ncbi:MAG: hypothetical protein U9R38_00165 [Candidatus Margulisiibacteriota bacterium]|nr:hypothetical protein [Candidatus Margulisiibacteriota bacterium]
MKITKIYTNVTSHRGIVIELEDETRYLIDTNVIDKLKKDKELENVQKSTISNDGTPHNFEKEEIKEVIGDYPDDFKNYSGLKRMFSEKDLKAISLLAKA